MDWFERITGFAELSYEETQARLRVQDGTLVSAHSDRQWSVGTLEVPSVAELRRRVAGLSRAGRTELSCCEGDARRLHSDTVNRGALFQVASQFNLLEMTGPSVTPEHGVTRYIHDHTQGPACAVAAGAGTIYRNYLVEVDGMAGQRSNRQLDCLADIGQALGNDGSLWQMRNGYALCTEEGLGRIDRTLESATSDELDRLRGLLRIGLHWNVEVTDAQDRAQGCLASILFGAAGRLHARAPSQVAAIRHPRAGSLL